MTSHPIIDFIEARLAEDEATALAAQLNAASGWVDDDSFTVRIKIRTELGWSLGNGPVHAHIALHDPARVLREVAAKRAILKDHQIKPATWSEPDDAEDFGCERCHFDRDEGVYGFGYCPTLKALVAVYSDHSDYDQSWSTT